MGTNDKLAKSNAPGRTDLTMAGQTMAGLSTNEMAATAVAAAAKANVEARFVMALHRPRNFDVARDRLLAACQRPGFAEKAVYRRPMGGETITGLSIRFAEEALRAWGNIDVQASIIYDDDERLILQVNCMDLETLVNEGDQTVITKRVERKNPKGREVLGQRINSSGDTTYICKASDEEVLVKVNAAKSRMIRNMGLRLIPSDVLEDARKLCDQTSIAETGKDIQVSRQKMVEAFNKLGVQPADIGRYLGHDCWQASVPELNELREVIQTVREGTPWREILAEKLADRAPEAPPIPSLETKTAGAPAPVPVPPAPEPKPEPAPEPVKAVTPAEVVKAQPQPAEPVQTGPVKSNTVDVTPPSSSWPDASTDAFADRLIAEFHDVAKRGGTLRDLSNLAVRKGQCPTARHAQVLEEFRKAQETVRAKGGK